MMCTDCIFESEGWECMKEHYKEKHPLVKNPSNYFTKKAKMK